MKKVYAEEVLQEVCALCDSHIEHCEHCPIKDAILNAPEAEKRRNNMSEWIKCSERLPEPRFAREWYLVGLESGCVMTLAFEKTENRWHETGSFVTHWMPLPDAPEVEG